tara:strand:+ start:2761 stop:3999 length:1239 start_codon:yes stop_codon:yes gene_type:complete
MQSFLYIESAIVLNLDSLERVQKLTVHPSNLSVFGPALKFVLSYYDDHHKFAPAELVLDKFPDLDKGAIGVDFDFALHELKEQVLFRKGRQAIAEHLPKLEADPPTAVRSLVSSLSGIDLDFAEDLTVYDSGGLERLENYKRRKQQRRSLKIIGVPTPFKKLNSTGMGWLPGDLVSIFARPTVGKTWLAIKAAAIATRAGIKTLFISPEMASGQISLRMDVIMGTMMGYRFSHRALRKGDATVMESDYEKFLKEVSRNNLVLCDHIGDSVITMNGVLSQIRKYKPQFVVIDGLHLITPDEPGQIWEQMYKLFYGMKKVCTAQGITALVATQARRSAHDLYEPPEPKDVMFGDALIQSSDMAFSMAKVRDDNMKRKICLQKYRDDEDPFRYLTMHWDVDKGYIEEVETEPESV